MLFRRLGGQVEIFSGLLFRTQRRVIHQGIGQGLQACFTRHLRLGAALGLIGQIQILQALLGLGSGNVSGQLRRELALRFNALLNRAAAIFQFTQIRQALVQEAQLRVVQVASSLLAVAGNKRHGGAFVNELDGGSHLGRTGVEFGGDALFDGRQHKERRKIKTGRALCLREAWLAMA